MKKNIVLLIFTLFHIIHGVETDFECPSIIANRYEVKKCANQGFEGRLFIVNDRIDRKEKVIKILFDFNPDNTPGDLKHFDLLHQLPPSKSHLVSPLEILQIPINGETLMGIVYERMEEDLFDIRLKKFHQWSSLEVQTLVSDVLNALVNLNNKQFVHGDVKPENILVRDGRYFLGDFGFLRPFSETNVDNRHQGTPCYFPPEYINSHRFDKMDIWSFGMTLFMLQDGKWKCASNSLKFKERIVVTMEQITTLQKRSIFGQKTIVSELKKIKRKVFWEKEKYEQFIDLVENMLNVNPEKRITAEQALKHPFLTNEPFKTYNK